jgi:hypothetical protein
MSASNADGYRCFLFWSQYEILDFDAHHLFGVGDGAG